MGWLDKGHMAKSVTSYFNIAVCWLSLSFLGIATASPLYNGLADFTGYLKPIEPRGDSNRLVKGARELGHLPCGNPFEYANDHPRARLRLNTAAFNMFVVNRAQGPAAQGVALSKIWRECLIRRGYRSALPYNSTNTIGASLPACRMAVLDLSFPPEAQRLYDEHAP